MREFSWRRLGIALEVVFVPVGLVILLWLTASERAIQLVSHAGWSVLLGVVFSQLSVVMFAVRLRLVLTMAGIRVSVWEATRLHVQSMFYYFFVPFGVGMEVYKVAKLYAKFPAADRVTVLAAVVFDRLLGFLTVVVIALLCGVAIVPRLSATIDPRNALLLVGVLVAVVALGAAAVVWVVRRGTLGNLRRFVPLVKTIGVQAVVLSFAMQMTLALAVYFAAIGWSVGLDYWQALFATASAIVFQVIPVNFLGIGGGEVAGVGIYILMGLSEQDAVLMVSSLYAYRLLTALLGGVWQLHDRRARDAAVSAEHGAAPH